MDLDFDYYDNETLNGTYFNALTSGYRFFDDYIAPPLLVLIGIVGLIGNGALIAILLKTNARSTPNAFILSITAANIIVILFYMPVAPLNTFPLGEAACKISEWCHDVASGVTAFSLIALIVFCFFETTPTSQSGWTHRTTVVAVGGVWALAVTFAAPTLLFAHVVHEHEGNLTSAFCFSFDPSSELMQGPFKFAVYYAVPVIAFGFLYSLARLSGSLDRQTTAQREVSILTIWLFTVYAGCVFVTNMTTFWIILPVEAYEFWELLDMTGFYLELAYRCLNPFVFYIVSENFRQLFDRFLLCWCVKGNREPVADDEINRFRC